MELESTPIVTFFDYILRIADKQEKSSSAKTKLDLTFTRNGESLAASGPVTRSDNGYWEIPLRTAFIPKGLLVLEIFDASHETGRHRLGSVFVDLEEIFLELGINVAIESVYDVVLESDDLPEMQLSWVAALYQDTYIQFPERRIPPFLDTGFGDSRAIRVYYSSTVDSSRPTITLFNLILSFADVEDNKPLISSSIKIVLVHDDTTVFESDSVDWDDANKCWIIKAAVTLSGSGIVVVNLLECNANVGTKKLGSTYIDIDTVSAVDGTLLTDHTEDVFLDSDDASAMKLRYQAASFPISGIARLLKLQWIPHFLFFEPCSDTTSPAAFKKYCWELQHLLCRNIMSLIITPEQAEQLATRCRSAPDFTMADQSYFLFLLPDFAELQFYFTSQGRMSLLSRLCDQNLNITATLAGLNGTELCALVSSVISLPKTYPAKMTLMLNFGSCLPRRYMGIQDENDLTQAIRLFDTAAQLQQWAYPGDEKQRDLNFMLAGAYEERFKLSKSVADLDCSFAAIDKLALGMLMWPGWADDEQQCEVWHLLAMNLLVRFGILGTRQDVDRALECVDKALALVPQDSLSRLEYLETRASALYARYTVLGDAAALELSLETRKAVSNLPSSHPAYARATFREGQALFDRVWHTLSQFHGEFLDEQFERSLNELKGMRHLTAREGADLERAITLSRNFIDTHPNHSDIDNFLFLLGESLFTRYLCQKDRRDLDDCVAALKRVSSDKQSNSLGHALFLQEDFQSSIAVFTKASTSPTLPPTYKLFAATCCAEIVLKRTWGPGRASACMSLLRTAMALLPSVVWIGMRVLDRYNVLMSWKTAFNTTYVPTQSAKRGPQSGGVFFTIGQVPSLSAAFAIEFGELHTAVEWLEQGRSIIWDQLLQFRIPLEDLKQRDLDLANRLNAVARDLAISSARTLLPGEDTSEDEKHRELVTKWGAGVAEARRLRGFEDFLMPKEYAYLAAAADDSVIVIINVDWRRCDALVIFPPSAGSDSSIHHVPLRADVDFISNVGKTYMELVELTRSPEPVRWVVRKPLQEALDPNAKFMVILSELWYQIVLPILVSCQEERPLLFTGTTGGPRPRVRWCPTGRLTFLPLHAAGDYSSSQKGHKVYDFVISSYIPTLSSIIRPPSSTQKPNILAISSATPQGYGSINGTQKELAHIEKCAESAGCEIVAIRENQATADRVLGAMKRASWVHFACHGIQNAENPTESALILQDGTCVKLTDFASLDLPHAEFAYLSACQTATGHAKLPSESVHLAAGMLLAGYRSVIATMWSIKDKYAPEVAADVYGYLLRKGKDRPDHKESALALDIAAERLRAKAGEREFFTWVPYIHIGA